MASIPSFLSSAPIQFGTDGWRGVLGVDFTMEKLLRVSAAAAQELAYQAPPGLKSRTVVIGYDRRFMAQELAESVADAVRGCELEPLITQTPVPTPACSWAVVNRKALGALVITASHNPPEWLGLKIKGAFGGSVHEEFTQAVERRLSGGAIVVPIEGCNQSFNGREEHLDGLRNKFEVNSLLKGLKKSGLNIIIDPMYGSAAGCIQELLGGENQGLVKEIRCGRDALFGGNPPEPVEQYLTELIQSVKAANLEGKLTIGLVFDGDGDRLAAIDEKGRFCSTQVLIPLLIDHLIRVKKLPGYIVKTVSGSDLMRLVAEGFGREVIELPVGFKYIASKMISDQVLIGGEESGGVGFGSHLPERDALFAAMLLIEALVESGKSLGLRLDELQKTFGFKSKYGRIDLKLKNMKARYQLESLLAKNPPQIVCNNLVKEVTRQDGLKLRLGPSYWVMMRFSGTEPLLRIYCEAPSEESLAMTLRWAQELAQSA